MILNFIISLYYQSSKASDHLQHPSDGPNGILDHILVAVSVLVVLIVLFLTIKYIIKPGEKQEDHIKRIILQDDRTGSLKDKE